MSPEQARGTPVDRRADIWAFGVVLFEMLTGKPLFRSETITDVLASVVREEPDWAALPSATPDAVRHLLRRCLTRDPRQRLQAIAEARIALEAPEATMPADGVRDEAGTYGIYPLAEGPPERIPGLAERDLPLQVDG